MGGLINDIAIELDAEQQRALALWAVKTAMVIEGVSRRRMGSTRRRSAAHHKTLVPPMQTAVWLGRCAQATISTARLESSMSRIRQRQTVSKTDARRTSSAGFLMQVLSVKRKPNAMHGSLRLGMRLGPWDKRLVQSSIRENQRVADHLPRVQRPR